jgi:broad specificity phosphatase PhoE
MEPRRIILVRHGKPDIDMSQPVSGGALDEWSARYDAAPLRPESLPPSRLREALAEATLVVASDLRRAHESALRALPGVTPVLDPLYREAPLPVMKKFPLVMHARRWAVAARIAWYFGASAGCESLRDVRRRARTAAGALTAYSAGHPVVALFAHGMFNRFLARALLRRGWRGPRAPAGSYWGFSVYEAAQSAAAAGAKEAAPVPATDAAAGFQKEAAGFRRRTYG